MRQTFPLIIAVLCFLFEPVQGQAGFTVFGPTPYLSVADSPFAPFLGNLNFYLEDFEDAPGCVPGPGSFCGGGLFDAPGASMIYGSTGAFGSVDADDGAIDGSGSAGASAVATSVYSTPVSSFYAIQIDFDAMQLGFLPTSVGFAITEGAGDLSGITVINAVGAIEFISTSNLHVSPQTTSDDRFIGVFDPSGVSSIVIGKTILNSSLSDPPRIDHLQYGLSVPEPSSFQLIVMTMLTALVIISRE